MKKLQLGKRNLLKVLRKKEHGVYLEGGEIGDILLPKRYVPAGTKVGDTLDVFLYLDQLRYFLDFLVALIYLFAVLLSIKLPALANGKSISYF